MVQKPFDFKKKPKTPKKLVPIIAWLLIFLTTVDKSVLHYFNTLEVVSCTILTLQEVALIV